MSQRYVVTTWHGEAGTVYNVVDAYAPAEEQPAVVASWSTFKDKNARFLAEDFCSRHN